MDQTHLMLIEVLNKISGQDVQIMKEAELQLKSWEKAEGFYPALLQIAFNENLEVNTRWLAVLCLKNGVEMYWRNTIPESEKYLIRQQLLCIQQLKMHHMQIWLQIAVIISKIARYDCPHNWPELIPTLLDGIGSSDPLYDLRISLSFHHVIKALASKRLRNDRLIFQEICALVFPKIVQLWLDQSCRFLDNINAEVIQSIFLFERMLLSLKMMKNIVVFCMEPCAENQDIVCFLTTILQQIKFFMDLRCALCNQNSTLIPPCEKYLAWLFKVLKVFQEWHPLAFVDFIQPTLECCTNYCFKANLKDALFERLNITMLIIIKNTLTNPQYNPKKCLNEQWWLTYDHERADATQKILGKDSTIYSDILTQRAHRIKKEFFTPSVLKEIIEQLMKRYFLLNQSDLENWENEPEDYASEEIGESWTDSLRPCAEVLYLTVFKEFREIVTPIVVEIAQSMPIHSSNDIIECLKKMQLNASTGSIEILEKEAVYNAIGLAAFDLFDDIDFNQWFIDVLIPEMKIKDPGYYIIRKRVIWLMGEWCQVKMAANYIPLLYEVILESMNNDENLVVRLTAARTLRSAVDNFEFHEDVFLPYLKSSITALFSLLTDVKNGDLKMSVLHVISLIIERMKDHVQPHVLTLMDYLPSLWEKSGNHNMLRCAIVSCFVQIVKSIRDLVQHLHSYLIPMIDVCTDVSQPHHVYLLEDGLELWLTLMKNANKCSPELLNVAQRLCPLIEYSNEHLQKCLRITEVYIFLTPDQFFKRYGQELSKTFQYILTDLKSDGVKMVLEVVETSIGVCLESSYVLFKPIFSFVLNLALDPDELPIQVSLALSLLSNVILLNQTEFLNILLEKSKESQEDVNIILRRLLKTWVGRVFLDRAFYRKKYMGLALACLLTSGFEVVHEEICAILLSIVETLDEITDKDLNYDSYYKEFAYSEEEDQYSGFSYHDRRKCLAMHNSPLLSKVKLRDYFSDQMKALELSVGPAKFYDLMSTVDVETMQQVQHYLQK